MDTVSVEKVGEGAHVGVAEVLPVGTVAVVLGVGDLPQPAGLSQLAPQFPEVIDERVMHEEDGLEEFDQTQEDGYLVG